MTRRDRPGGAASTTTTGEAIGNSDSTFRVRPQPAVIAAKKLFAAERLIGEARMERLIAGDCETARRLSFLATQVRDHAEMLDEHGRNMRPIPRPSYPPGKTIGWLVRHDATIRAMRRAAGLSVPEVSDVV